MTMSTWLLGDWPPLLLVYGSLCVFCAAIVRGYSGFGFSLLSITALSLVLPPVRVVPSIFLLEIAESIRLLPEVWGQVHWRSIRLLLMGCFLATPLGVWALANVPAAPMKLALAIFVLLSAILLIRGVTLKDMPGTVGTFGTGVATGLLNGGFGIGGPPLVIFYLSTPAGVAAGRASIIAFIIGTDLMGLGFQAPRKAHCARHVPLGGVVPSSVAPGCLAWQSRVSACGSGPVPILDAPAPYAARHCHGRAGARDAFHPVTRRDGAISSG